MWCGAVVGEEQGDGSDAWFDWELGGGGDAVDGTPSLSGGATPPLR